MITDAGFKLMLLEVSQICARCALTFNNDEMYVLANWFYNEAMSYGK